MWIGMPFRSFIHEELFRWKTGRDGLNRKTPCSGSLEGIPHPTLKLQTGIEHQVSREDTTDIRSLGLVEMWVHPFAHDADDFNPITAHMLDGIGHHGRRRHDRQPARLIFVGMNVRSHHGTQYENHDKLTIFVT
jgi:hypothetical protein